MSKELDAAIEAQKRVGQSAKISGDKPTLQDMSDAEIWQRFNIVLQVNNEAAIETGNPGDAARQLTILSQECVRRDMFGRSVEKREPSKEQLWTWYVVLKQLLEGEQEGLFDNEGNVEETGRQYTMVVKALKELGEEMPAQGIGLEPIPIAGRLISG
jgi:hypothetical protein